MLSAAETARLTLPPKDGGKTATPHRQGGTFIFVITAVLGDVRLPSEPNILIAWARDAEAMKAVNSIHSSQPVVKQGRLELTADATSLSTWAVPSGARHCWL